VGNWVRMELTMKHERKVANVRYTGQVFRATERAMERAASVAQEDFKRGLNNLATIASIAPFVGMLGTLWAIGFDTFRGIGTDKYTALAMNAEGISRACVPTALGLFVGLQSLWAYKYLLGRLAHFDSEMADASLSLINHLSLHFGHLRFRRSD
jgi:biopolymer transport protein TolQ